MIFLLDDTIQVSVCIDKLDDVMLALLIARLVEGSQKGEIFRSILQQTILPRAKKNKELELASIAYWLLGEYKDAVEVLVPELPKTTEFYSKLDPFSKTQKYIASFLYFSILFPCVVTFRCFLTISLTLLAKYFHYYSLGPTR